MSELQISTFCTANGSLCSWSRYFSRLKKVSKNMWAIRQRFKSPRVILPGGGGAAEAKRLWKFACCLIVCCTNLGFLVWPGRASGRADPGRAGVRCPSSPSSHTVPHRNTPAHTWTRRRRRRCPCSGTSTRCWRGKTRGQREHLGLGGRATFIRLAA